MMQTTPQGKKVKILSVYSGIGHLGHDDPAHRLTVFAALSDLGAGQATQGSTTTMREAVSQPCQRRQRHRVFRYHGQRFHPGSGYDLQDGDKTGGFTLRRAMANGLRCMSTAAGLRLFSDYGMNLEEQTAPSCWYPDSKIHLKMTVDADKKHPCLCQQWRRSPNRLQLSGHAGSPDRLHQLVYQYYL